MISSRRLRLLLPLTAVGLFAVALLALSANAAKVPSFWSSGQYEALVKFVDKLNGLSSGPATAAQKAVYEGQLENKHDAAVNKSAALFNRGKKVAKAESQRAFKVGVRTIRRTEAGELAALRRDYDARMSRAGVVYERELSRIEEDFDAQVASLRKEIKRLRKQKANAKSALAKLEIQEALERRAKRIVVDRELEAEEISDLRAGYRKEKNAIRAGKASATRSVQQSDDEAIVTLRNRGNRIYNTRVRTLQSQRVNQLQDLEVKLSAGRAAIARMATNG